MEENKNLLSARQVAARLGISRPTLSRLIRDKKIGVYRIGTRTLFDDAVVEEYKQRRFVAPEADAPLLRSKNT